MHVYHGTRILLTRTRYQFVYPQSPLPCTSSWQRSSCSGWRYSASSALPEMRLKRCESPRTGWRCVQFQHFMSHPKSRLTPGPGIPNARPRQRLFPFRNQILRDHQHILSAYLSFGAGSGAKEFDRPETLRITCPPLHSNRVWRTYVVGWKYRGRSTSL